MLLEALSTPGNIKCFLRISMSSLYLSNIESSLLQLILVLASFFIDELLHGNEPWCKILLANTKLSRQFFREGFQVVIDTT